MPPEMLLLILKGTNFGMSLSKAIVYLIWMQQSRTWKCDRMVGKARCLMKSSKGASSWTTAILTEE